MQSLRWVWPWASLMVGVVVLLGTGAGLLVWWSSVLSRVVGITVPTEGPVRVVLPRDGAMALWRELAGPHVTVNNPIAEAPADLEILVTDAGGARVEVRPYGWSVGQQFLGLERQRRGVAVFDPPTREVSVEIRSTELARAQVYSIGPAHDLMWRRARVPAFAGLGAGVLLLLAGIAELLRRRQAAAFASVGGFEH